MPKLPCRNIVEIWWLAILTSVLEALPGSEGGGYIDPDG